MSDGVSAVERQPGSAADGPRARYRQQVRAEVQELAWRQVAELVEAAADDPAGRSARARRTAIATTIRRWALTNPHRDLLIYGTPVPGYTSPAAATGLATRIFVPIQAAFSAAGPEQTLARSLTFWTRVHGVLSLEVARALRGDAVRPGPPLP